jgi:hypothetical protein
MVEEASTGEGRELLTEIFEAHPELAIVAETMI